MKHHYTSFWPHLNDPKLSEWQSQLPTLIEAALLPDGNGNLPRWQAALASLQQLPGNQPHQLDQAWVSVGEANALNAQQHLQLEHALRALHPWRKGPFKLFDIEIDTEWHSDWKWDRVLPHLAPLQGKTVLDIGCGSGYHLWRMLGQGAQLAIGVDPSLLFMSQFLALKQFIGQDQPAYFLPLTLEQLPVSPKGGFFDTVFSMGVLYHRRSPIDHIYELKAQLKPGGQLVLETLVISEDYGQLLVPEDRYAQMRNVWFLPSVPELTRWLERCGFSNVRCVDLNQTSTAEQRTTDWMQWNSLESFLDPNDHNLTVEGYPAPLRAVMVCNTPLT